MKDPFTPVQLKEVKDKKSFLVQMADAIEDKGTLLSRVVANGVDFRPAREFTKALIYKATHSLCERYTVEFDEVKSKANAYLVDLVAHGNFRPFTKHEAHQHRYPNATFIASYMTLAIAAEMVSE